MDVALACHSSSSGSLRNMCWKTEARGGGWRSTLSYFGGGGSSSRGRSRSRSRGSGKFPLAGACCSMRVECFARRRVSVGSPAHGNRRLLGGSIYELARLLPQSRLRFDQIGGLFGESGFGPISQIVTAGLEGMLFAAGVTAAILLAQRQRSA